MSRAQLANLVAERYILTAKQAVQHKVFPYMMASVLMALAASAAQPATPAPLLRDPQAMSATDIRAYNAGRASNEPAYIRCERGETTGSLVRKAATCHTNARWTELGRAGNQVAREMYGSVPSAATTSSN